MADRPGAVAAAGDHRHHAVGTQALPQRIAVVAAVGDQPLATAGRGDQGWSGADVGAVAGRQAEGDRPAEEVGGEVDLGRPAAARDTDRLRFGPPLAPPAERWALT